MNPQDAIDLGREAVKACLLVGGPVLLASLVIGLIVGIAQAMTQVQDQTVSFVPKLVCLLLVLGLCLPWLTDQMVNYAGETLGKPMTHFNSPVPAIQTGSTRMADNSDFSIPPTQLPNFESNSAPAKLPKLDDPAKEGQSPFKLPQHRYSRLPKENIDG